MTTQEFELYKTALTVGGTLLAALVGAGLTYILTSYSRQREERRRVSNLKRLIFTEMLENCVHLIAWMPENRDDRLQFQLAAKALRFALKSMQFGVLEANLGLLRELEAEMMAKIYEAYYKAQEAIHPTIDYDEFAPQQVYRVTDELLESMGIAIKTFKRGEAALEFLKQKKGEGIRRVLKEHSERGAQAE